jgi:hypothetical protein
MSDFEQLVSLEYETTVSARGIAPANAVVEQIDGTQCRLRTVVLFDVGETIEFALRSSHRDEVTVRGTVASLEIKGHRFAYVMRLDKMSANEIAALRKVLDAFDALDDFADRAEGEVPPAAIDHLMRNCARIPADFDITFRTPAFDFKPAKAVDISRSGLLISCAEVLVPGVPLEIRFTLPGRRAKEVTLAARVVTRQEPVRGTFLYGLALTCVSDRDGGLLDGFVTAASQPPR